MHRAAARGPDWTVGQITVTALSDGALDIPADRILQDPDLTARQFAAAGRAFPPRLAVNAFLIRNGARLALVDTGSALSMGPLSGALQDSLMLAGVTPDQIDTVLLTHIHPDHSNGLRLPDGRARFPRAELVVHQHDLDFWCDPGGGAAARPALQSRHVDAAFQIAAYADRLRPLRAGAQVFPGVTALPAPGHTPGHMAYRVDDGSASLLIWGDAVHVAQVQVANPDVGMVFDIDPATAIASRRRLFDMAVAGGLPVAGMHLDLPGPARLTRGPGGYRLEAG
jgi:glyoxylase-like metal-dependent hydrolase (beta-lactamase superfamily II)